MGGVLSYDRGLRAKLLQSCLILYDPMDCMEPSRFLCPCDSPGKHTGVGCHALLHWLFLTQGSNPRLLRLLHRPAGSFPLAPIWQVLEREKRLTSAVGGPDKNTGVGCHAFRQGIFPTQGSNSGLCVFLYWQADS